MYTTIKRSGVDVHRGDSCILLRTRWRSDVGRKISLVTVSVENTACAVQLIAHLMPISACRMGCVTTPTVATTGEKAAQIQLGNLMHAPRYVALVVRHQSTLSSLCFMLLTKDVALAIYPDDPSKGDYSVGSASLTICGDGSICCGYQNLTD